MSDDSLLKSAVDRAWAVHLATHDDVDAADERRCSLERYLSGKWRSGESDPDELTCHGLAYLDRLGSEDCEVRMAAFAKVMVCLATRTARPDWTLAALASLQAAGLLASLRFAFG